MSSLQSSPSARPQARTPPPMLRMIAPRDVPSAATGCHRLERSRPAGPSRSAVPIIARTPLLDQAAELANRGRFDEADRGLRAAPPAEGPHAPAYYLLGMICQAAGDRRRAEDCFQKTVYLDPRHDEALLALALLAERRGDHERPPASVAAPSGSRP